MGKKTAEYIIRPMQEEDTAQVAKVEADAFEAPWPEAAFIEELKNPLTKYIVLESEGIVCGYAGFWLVIGEAQVTNIALMKSCRGKGWGSVLLDALINLAKENGADSIVLEVRRSNEIAQKMYKEHGFSVNGVRSNYYHDNGEDALLMQQDLEVKSEIDE